MSTLTLDKAYTTIAQTMGKFSWDIPSKKSVSAIQKVISITTDKNSLKSSKDLLEKVIKVQDSLLQKIEAGTIEKHISTNNDNLTNINGFFDFFDNLFNDNNEDEKIVIDDPKMIQFIDNMKKAKSVLEYISEYLECVKDVEKSKKAIKDGTAKKYCYTVESKFVEIAA